MCSKQSYNGKNRVNKEMVINMIDKTHKFVKSYQDVLDVFGYFPTFHDDKIVKYSIKKNDLFVTIRTVQNGMNSLSKKRLS